MSDERITQAVVEVIYIPAPPDERITQAVVEVIYVESAATGAAPSFHAQVIG